MIGRVTDRKFAISSEAVNGGLQHRLDEIVTAAELGKIAAPLQGDNCHCACGGYNERGNAGPAYKADRGAIVRESSQHRDISRWVQTHSRKAFRDLCVDPETFGMPDHPNLTMSQRTMARTHAR